MCVCVRVCVCMGGYVFVCTGCLLNDFFCVPDGNGTIVRPSNDESVGSSVCQS